MQNRINRLFELRMETGKPQEVVSGFACVSQSTYSRYESGGCAIPSDKLIILAELFNVSLEYLLCMTDSRHGCFTSETSSKLNALIAFYTALSDSKKLAFDKLVEAFKMAIDDK